MSGRGAQDASVGRRVFLPAGIPSCLPLPKGWPKEDGLRFVTFNVWATNVPRELRNKLRPTTKCTGPCPKVSIRRIDEPGHPACGQRGLFAAVKLEPRAYVMDYVGYLHPDCDSSKESDYVLKFAEGMSIDAEFVGNEARFINDFRGITGVKRPNVAFENRTDPHTGEVRIGVWVLSEAIRKGAELCVSYGKGFWKHRSTDTDDNTGEGDDVSAMQDEATDSGDM